MFLPHAPPGPAPVGIGTVAGTPSKCSRTQIEGQEERQQQRRQTTAHPLLADVDSESVQTAIQRLFDTRIMRTLHYAIFWYI